jgi:positive regulator of sigma E activity
MYAWVYILHMFRGLVFTSIASNAVPLFFLHCLRIFRSFLIIVLGVILAYPYLHLCKTCLKKDKLTRVYYFFKYMYFKIFDY